MPISTQYLLKKQKNDKRNGYGAYYWTDGMYEMGQYIDDARNGYFTRYSADGTYTNLYYENGKLLYSQGMNEQYSTTY